MEKGRRTTTIALLLAALLCPASLAAGKKLPRDMIHPTLESGPGARVQAANPEQAKAVVRSYAGRPQALLEAYREGDSPAASLDTSAFGIGPETTVADLGCGTGGLEVQLLVEGRAFARLYAVDIDQPSLDLLGLALDSTGLPGKERIERVLSKEDDVSLPARSVDVALIIDTSLACHEDPATTRLLLSLRKALKPGGRVHHVWPLEPGPKLPSCLEKGVVAAFRAAGFQLATKGVVASRKRVPGSPRLSSDFRQLVFAPAEAAAPNKGER